MTTEILYSEHGFDDSFCVCRVRMRRMKTFKPYLVNISFGFEPEVSESKQYSTFAQALRNHDSVEVKFLGEYIGYAPVSTNWEPNIRLRYSRRRIYATRAIR